MAAVENVKKFTLSASQSKLVKILKENAGRLTIEELTPIYAKEMGKKQGKKGSLTTLLSQTRKAITEAGKKFPASWEPKRASGGGRTSERQDMGEVLSSIGVDFDELEDVEDSEAAE